MSERILHMVNSISDIFSKCRTLNDRYAILESPTILVPLSFVFGKVAEASGENHDPQFYTFKGGPSSSFANKQFLIWKPALGNESDYLSSSLGSREYELNPYNQGVGLRHGQWLENSSNTVRQILYQPDVPYKMTIVKEKRTRRTGPVSQQVIDFVVTVMIRTNINDIDNRGHKLNFDEMDFKTILNDDENPIKAGPDYDGYVGDIPLADSYSINLDDPFIPEGYKPRNPLNERVRPIIRPKFKW
jgi:hypothetical protein